MYEIIKWASKQRPGFFLREKSNGEWEAGWGDAGGEMTVRADTPIATMQALHSVHRFHVTD